MIELPHQINETNNRPHIMKKSFIKNSAIIFKGLSKLDNKPIVVIGTGNTNNRKTGDMLQLWILSDNGSNPVEAKNNGLNDSICGVCPIKKECYVNLGQAPLAIYRAYKRGRYNDLSDNMEGLANFVKGKKVRFGAYGDLAAMPYDLCAFIIENCVSHTAYTHQTKHKNYDIRFNTIAHLSIETAKQSAHVAMNGLGNTFRIVSDYSHKLEHEIICPFENEENPLKCENCGICNGKNKSVVIKAHGSKGKKLSDTLSAHSKPSNKDLIIPLVNVTQEQISLF